MELSFLCHPDASHSSRKLSILCFVKTMLNTTLCFNFVRSTVPLVYHGFERIQKVSPVIFNQASPYESQPVATKPCITQPLVQKRTTG